MNSATLALQNPGLARLRDALGKPSGARFYRCALQVNPHSYSERFRGESHGYANETEFIRATLERAVANGIEVLAITDHNNADSVDAFRTEGERLGVAVFPGFEINSTEGIHLLCLYPRDIDARQLGRFLGEFGIIDTASSSTLSKKSFAEILELVRERGGVTIAAHVTNENGLLHRLKGQPCIQAWRDPNLLAIQIPGSVDDLPHDKKQIVTNRNPEYRRLPGRGTELGVAVVNARDVKAPEDLDQPTSSTFIKMSEVTIEALRQAFLDPESRIRLGKDEPEEPQHSEFVAIAWEGGFLDGLAIHLNGNLNVLVGGRGTGKSTIVESIRYALGAIPKAEEARRVHESIVRNVVQAGTKISLLVRARKHVTADYVIERTVPNPPIVRNANGEVIPVAPVDLLGAVEIYGQHEISEIAKSADKRTALLSRFVAHDAATERRKLEVKRALDKSRVEIQSISGEIGSIRDRLALLPRIEETLKAYQSAGLEQKLAQHTLLLREERVFSSIPERLEPIEEAAAMLRREIPVDAAFVNERALADLENRDVLARIGPILQGLSNDVADAVAAIDRSIERTKSEIAAIRADWDQRKSAVDDDYQRVLREFQKTKVNADEFMQLRRQIEQLKPLRDRLDLLNRNLAEQSDRRRNLIAEWEDVLRSEFQALDRAAKDVTRRLRPRVRVRVHAAGNREPLDGFLREHVAGKGRLSDALTALKNVPSLSLRALVEDCRGGKEALTSKYLIPPAQAERICQMHEDSKMQLEELELPATTDIELNVAAEGETEDWKTLEDLSTGQKATAILLLLLLESDSPLVVDQPEDDLDNRFISEGVVPKMREEKQRRQFLFATHNANIPVLGDAELILGLRARESRSEIPPEWIGSIDSPSVQKLVEETLEGGREAFETRRLKYGFGSPDATH